MFLDIDKFYILLISFSVVLILTHSSLNDIPIDRTLFPNKWYRFRTVFTEPHHCIRSSPPGPTVQSPRLPQTPPAKPNKNPHRRTAHPATPSRAHARCHGRHTQPQIPRLAAVPPRAAPSPARNHRENAQKPQQKHPKTTTNPAPRAAQVHNRFRFSAASAILQKRETPLAFSALKHHTVTHTPRAARE